MKWLKKLLMGSPRKGESMYFTTTFNTTMPPGVKISFKEWEGGAWINNLNM